MYSCKSALCGQLKKENTCTCVDHVIFGGCYVTLLSQSRDVTVYIQGTTLQVLIHKLNLLVILTVSTAFRA